MRKRGIVAWLPCALTPPTTNLARGRLGCGGSGVEVWEAGSIPARQAEAWAWAPGAEQALPCWSVGSIVSACGHVGHLQETHHHVGFSRPACEAGASGPLSPRVAPRAPSRHARGLGTRSQVKEHQCVDGGPRSRRGSRETV